MNIYTLSSLLAFLICAGLAIFIFANKKKQATQRLFAFVTFFTGSWCLYPFIAYTVSDPIMRLNIARIIYFFAIFTPPLFLNFILVAIDQHKSATNTRVIYSSYFIASLLLLISWTPLFVRNIEKMHYYSRIVPGNLFYLFVLFFGMACGYAFVALYRELRLSEGDRKNQLKYLFLGFFIAFISGFLHFLPIFNIREPFPHDILVITYTLIIAYAIARHQLLEIEVIVKKTIIFAGIFTFTYGIFIGAAYLSQGVFQHILGTNRWLAMVPSVLIIISILKPLEKLLTNITDRYLFQKKYNYKELLKTFTTEVLTVLELDKLVNLTVDKLTDIVKMKSAAVLLFDDEKQQFNVMASQNIKDSSVTLIRPDGIVTFMEETHGYVLVSELKEKNISIPDSIQEIMEKLNAELIIPMILHEEVMGALSLGKKKSDESYTQDDLDILLPLAKTLAIAISNAQLFVELGKTQAEAAQKEKMAVIGTLSAGINHEICNPLGIARGQCEAFLLNMKDGLYKNKTSEELITKAKDIMAKVIKETDRATAITKKLSGFAKPSKGESEIVHIDKELDEVFGLVGYELKLEKIEFKKNIQKDISDLFVDKKQFQEVLFNLIRNAGQAIGEKGRITINASEESGTVFIDVKDTGSGIPEDKVKLLFNPFFTTKDPGKGTGLGLFIVRQVVEKNNGRIYLKETRVGEGTTFRLEFPSSSKEGAKIIK